MIVCENLVRIYKAGDIEVVALQGLDLTVDDGELMAIVGNSGSGKSTLLNIIGGLDKPSAGSISVAEKDLLKLDGKALIEYRRQTVGFVWQNNARNLIPYLSALENVELPMSLAAAKNRKSRARALLDMLGLANRSASKTVQLSGGEQQRVAIAIALANNPRLLLADEPTGNVDSHVAEQILQSFRRISRELGVTVVVVTHDRRIARAVDRCVAIRDGRTSSELIRKRSYSDEMAELSFAPTEAETHEELAVIDRAGRLQLPKEFLDAAGLSGKTRGKVELDGKRIVVFAPEEQEEQK